MQFDNKQRQTIDDSSSVIVDSFVAAMPVG